MSQLPFENLTVSVTEFLLILPVGATGISAKNFYTIEWPIFFHTIANGESSSVI